METDCTGPDWVGYNGNISNTEREILKGNEFLELSKRTNKGQTYIRNAIIQNLNLEEKLKIRGANWADVTFENSNLSKMSVLGMMADATTLEFKNTTLPYNMSQTGIGKLILNNVTFPKQEIMEDINNPENQGSLNDLNFIVPDIEESLEIYGYVKDSPLNDLTSDQLDELVRTKQMPKIYKGPMDIYNKLKTYIYKGESKTINGQNNPNYTGNTTGSLNIHKPQDQLLAILKKRQERSHG